MYMYFLSHTGDKSCTHFIVQYEYTLFYKIFSLAGYSILTFVKT